MCNTTSNTASFGVLSDQLVYQVSWTLPWNSEAETATQRSAIPAPQTPHTGGGLFCRADRISAVHAILSMSTGGLQACNLEYHHFFSERP
jgi:hypothetical protein